MILPWNLVAGTNFHLVIPGFLMFFSKMFEARTIMITVIVMFTFIVERRYWLKISENKLFLPYGYAPHSLAEIEFLHSNKDISL